MSVRHCLRRRSGLHARPHVLAQLVLSGLLVTGCGPSPQKQASGLMANGMYGEAVSILARDLERHPEHDQSALLLGYAYANLALMDARAGVENPAARAIEILDALARRRPTDARALYARAAAAFFLEKYPSAAVPLLEAALRSRPDFLPAVVLLGRCRLSTQGAVDSSLAQALRKVPAPGPWLVLPRCVAPTRYLYEAGAGQTYRPSTTLYAVDCRTRVGTLGPGTELTNIGVFDRAQELAAILPAGSVPQSGGADPSFVMVADYAGGQMVTTHGWLNRLYAMGPGSRVLNAWVTTSGPFSSAGRLSADVVDPASIRQVGASQWNVNDQCTPIEFAMRAPRIGWVRMIDICHPTGNDRKDAARQLHLKALAMAGLDSIGFHAMQDEVSPGVDVVTLALLADAWDRFAQTQVRFSERGIEERFALQWVAIGERSSTLSVLDGIVEKISPAGP